MKRRRGPVPAFERTADYHVYPTFGREHVHDETCWCQPTRDSKEPRVVIHRVVN